VGVPGDIALVIPDVDEAKQPIFWRNPDGGWVFRIAYRLWLVRF